MGRVKDLKGKKFGRLTVIEQQGINKNRKALWLCVCDCGNSVVLASTALVSNNAKSCGCLRKEKTSERVKTHGLSKTRIYTTWSHMKDRCYNPNDAKYKNYGERGITICDEWKDNFQSFFKWSIENGYADNLTIDRIDVNGNYEPSNCRWATAEMQASNRRTSHLITHNGKTQTMKQWANELGIKYSTLAARINVYKWDIEKAFYHNLKG